MIVRNMLADEFLKLAISAGALPDIVEPSPGGGTVTPLEAPQFRHGKGPRPMLRLIEAAQEQADATASPEARQYWTDARQKARAQKVFKGMHGRLRQEGVLTGAGKYRVAIPKHVLTKDDLEQHLGFVPVTIAVPESGQQQFGSWRHPDHNVHIHNHDSHWVMHEDDHASSTMLMYKRKLQMQKAKEQARVAATSPGGKKGKPAKVTGLGDIAKTTIQGLPHVLGEGVPGMYYYTKNRLLGGGSMLDEVQSELPKSYHRRVARMKASPTYQRAMAGGHDAAEQVRSLPHRAHQMRQDMAKQAFKHELRLLAGRNP